MVNLFSCLIICLYRQVTFVFRKSIRDKVFRVYFYFLFFFVRICFYNITFVRAQINIIKEKEKKKKTELNLVA